MTLPPQTVPVLIVGGDPVGMTLAARTRQGAFSANTLIR